MKKLKESYKARTEQRTDLVTKNDTITINICGGAHSKRVIDGLYPIVATIVGKKVKNDCETSKKTSAVAIHHTVQSVKASTRPDDLLLSSE